MGIVYLDFSYGRDLPPKILTDLGVEKPEEYGENFMRELFQLFPWYAPCQVDRWNI